VIDLPHWAVATPRRREHMDRVSRLMAHWAAALNLPAEQHAAWRDAGALHDALRDASDDDLRALLPDRDGDIGTFHGPAAAMLLERDGETRTDLLEAIAHHTVGKAGWERTGRALYMADYLEPGRPFSRRDRAFLAAAVPSDFDGVFRQVVRLRLERTLREGGELYDGTVALWNSVR
jgi:HD superfamily phosphohydrolase YqeK